MRHLPPLRLPALVRRPGRPRSRPRSRPKVRVAMVVAALFALALTGLSAAAGTAARAATEGPYGGTAAAVPGTVFAENYDTGGQGTAYNVTSVNGTDNGYRSDGVDLETTTDTGGPANDLGWTAAGQWFKYTVNVTTAGTYTVGLRLASPSGVTDGLHIANSAGTNLSGSVNVPATGGWQTWATVVATVTLPAGQQTLTVDQDNGGWNINFLAFGLNTSGGGGTGDQPYGGTPAAVPGTVQAENYDTGGQAVAYNVTALNGSGNGYRPDGVDLEATTDTGGGYDLGWTAAGQWFKYTVNVATAGAYTVNLRLAAPTAVTDALHIANSAGTNLSGNVTAPATGGYQTWTTVTLTRHPARGHPDADRGPGQRRLEHQLPGLRHQRRRRAAASAGSRPASGATPAASRPRRTPSSSTSSTPPTARTPTVEVYWSVNGVDRVDRAVAVLLDGLVQLLPDLLLPRLAHQLVQRLHRAELQRHHDQRRHLAGRRVPAAAGDPPAQLRRHRHRRRRERLGLRREQDRPVHAVRELRPRGLQAARHREAPYNIPAPTDVAAFQPGGADASYMTSYAASLGDTETTQQVFGCQGGGSPALNGNAALCAGLNRCVAQFSTTVQNTPSDYYQNAPCNYYSAFWHSVAVNGLAYGFAYDDDNGQSSDFNSTDAQYVQVAVGF